MKILTELILTQRSFMITLLAFALSPGAGYAAGSKKMISLDNTDFVVLISFLTPLPNKSPSKVKI